MTNKAPEQQADLAVTVKPLVWGRAKKSGMNLQADTAFGRYYIAFRGDNNWLWWRPASGPAHHGNANSEAEATRQCRADYEKRILSALDLTPADATAALQAEKDAVWNEAIEALKGKITQLTRYNPEGSHGDEALLAAFQEADALKREVK